MRIYNSIEDFKKNKDVVLTTGTFDGVHIGHQKIIKRVKQLADKYNGESAILTFFPHPRMVLFPDDNEIKLLNTIEERVELLRKFGIDSLIIHPFTKEFSRLRSLDFVRDILVNKIGTKKLVIGYDHHFGRNREGSFEHLKEYAPLYGFDVEEIPAQEIDDINVSSTKIRKALLKGDVTTASHFLGYCYKITVKVVRGKALGRKLSYPTANIEVQEKYKLIPANGIYAVKVIIDGIKKAGMLSIGERPTIPDANFAIEVNIFDFNADIYGKTISIEFVKRIRNEEKFDGLDTLKAQLHRDKIAALNILQE